MCREISWPRIKVLTERFTDLINTSTTNGEEFFSMRQAFDQSIIEGQRTVISEQTDCATADRDLADLERNATPQPPTAVMTAGQRRRSALAAAGLLRRCGL
jgi:branched-chain amino acid transport system substrate-binding protein